MLSFVHYGSYGKRLNTKDVQLVQDITAQRCTRRNFLKAMGLVVASIAMRKETGMQSTNQSSRSTSPSDADTRRPNIIWIMADDLSWGDLGCYGQEKIKTPNIDALAAGGMRFSQCYSGSTVCAPSRSSLMQGLHQGHATVRDNMIEHGRRGVYRHSLQPGDVTVAQVLKKAGYATGLFGKWGLALSDQPGIPNNMGFDSFFGYLNQRKAHSYYPEYLWCNRDKIMFPEHRGHNHKKPNQYDRHGRIIVNGVRDPSVVQYSFDLYATEAEKFVRINWDKPFFLYLAYTTPHGALEVPELGQYTHLDWPSVTHKIWAAMITRMDAAIGRLMNLLKALGIYEQTLIFFTSDNGYSGDSYANNPSLDEFFHHRGPWRGEKGNLGQGGLRVPAIAHWPGRIKPGTTSDLVWAFWDFLPTAAEAAGVAPPDRIDGISILPTLRGEPKRQQLHDYLYWEYGHEQAIRLGNRYIYRPHPDRPTEVYDALEDPGQTTNLAEAEPQTVRHAEAIFKEAHSPTPYYPSPGQTREQWERQLHVQGITLPDNADG